MTWTIMKSDIKEKRVEHVLSIFTCTILYTNLMLLCTYKYIRTLFIMRKRNVLM